jgi:1-acyl-sn-glycerol-3-phosphate acyltransferase
MPMDVPIIAVAIAEEFGEERPLYCLSHDVLFTGPLGAIMPRFGMIHATRENAHEVLTSGGVTIVFPGGDFDTLRPQGKANVIDFNGRTGYVRTALEAGVPILPVVSIGGHEDQFHLTRGEWLARFSPLRRLSRLPYFPVSFGFPFGLTPAFPMNLPLPTKITTQVLEPVDITAEFGADPDIAEVDSAIRSRMQDALDVLASQRRFPVLG